MAENETYTLAAAARKLGLSRDTIRRAIKSGRLYAIRNNDGSLTITEVDLQAFAASRATPASPQSAAGANPIPTMPAPANASPDALVPVPRDVLNQILKTAEQHEAEKNELWELFRGVYRKLERQADELAELRADLAKETVEKGLLQRQGGRLRKAITALLAADEDIDEGE